MRRKALLAAALAFSIPLAAATAAASAEPQQRSAPRSYIPARGDTTVGMFLAADSAMSSGSHAEAAELFARAAEQAGGSAGSYLREQALYSGMLAGNVELALEVSRNFDEASATARRLALLVQATDDLSKQNGARAYDVLSSGDIGQPYRTAAVLLRPWAAIQAGNLEGALPSNSSRRADALTRAVNDYNRALVLEATGQFQEAEAAYEGLLENPITAQVTLSYGAFLERQGRRRDAIRHYQSFLQTFPGSPHGEQALARARNRRADAPALTPTAGAAEIMIIAAAVARSEGQADTWQIYNQLARHLAPERTDVLLSLGEFEMVFGQPDRAREYYTSIDEVSPDYLAARTSLVDSYRATGDIEDALATARQMVASSPDNRSARLTLAQLLAGTDHHAEAIEVLDRIIRETGRDAPWDLYFIRAISLENTGQWDRAEADLQHALEIEPNQADVMNYLGYIWADRNENLDEALSLLERAARAEPNSGHIIDSLGWVYYRRGDTSRAIEQLERAVELEPSDPTINDHLGDAYLSAGRTIEAVFQWERVLTLEPEAELEAEVEAKLRAHSPEATVASAER